MAAFTILRLGNVCLIRSMTSRSWIMNVDCSHSVSPAVAPQQGFLKKKPRENGRAEIDFGRSLRWEGSAGVGDVGWRGPGRVLVVRCLQGPSAGVAGIRASSGMVVLRCAQWVSTQLCASKAVLTALAELRFPVLCLLLPAY